MKRFKKLASLLLVVVMVFAFCIPTFAATSDSYTITIENTTAGKTYTAYKIFDATYDGDGAVSYTIKATDPWYDIVANGYTATTTDGETTTTKDYASPFNLTLSKDANGDEYYVVTIKTTTKTDEETGETTTVNAYSDDEIIAFFQNATIPEGATTNSVSKSATGGEMELVVTSLGAGYYYITSTLGATVTLTTAAPDATVIDKNDEPTMEKWIIVDGEKQKWDTEAMDDEVEFEVNSYVPKYISDNLVTNYQFYDEMTTGLDIELTLTAEQYAELNTSGTVTVVTDKETGATTTLNCYYYNSYVNEVAILIDSVKTEYTDENGDTQTGYAYYGTEATFNKIVTAEGLTASDYYCAGDFTDAVYSCTFALVSGEGEDNALSVTTNDDGTYTVTAGGFVLTYYVYDKDNYVEGGDVDTSNYPNQPNLYLDYTANVDTAAEFEEDNTVDMDWWVTSYLAPTPNTPSYGGEIQDETENYETELRIIKTDATGNERLEGAVFTLTGEALHEVKITTYTYTELAEDETADTIYYKQEDGTFTTEEVEGSARYSRTVDVTYKIVTEDVTVQATSGTDGTILINGLDAGTYTLTELVAPDGYNLLDGPITITIAYDHDNDQWSYTLSGSGVTAGTSYVDENAIFEVTVVNNSGTELPGTGGIGTTVFYVIGIILVLGAAVILITRRRMNANR